MKIISYFQFILITSHFETILKESMIVKTSKNSIEKNQRFLTLAFAIQILLILTIILSLRIILNCDIIRENWK